jgi:uncharacterized protein
VLDVDGAALPAGRRRGAAAGAGARRHAELEPRHRQRDWFDPWIFQLDDADSPSEAVLPWVAGFAAAHGPLPGLMAVEDPELVEPLALLYLHFDPDDLEDADALLRSSRPWSRRPTWPRRCRTWCAP